MNLPSNNAAPFAPDTSVFLQNCKDFTARFPEQAALLNLNSSESALERLRELPSDYRLVQTKAKGEALPTLTIRGHFLHSQYNPVEEARRILGSEFFSQETVRNKCIFAGLGLGYLAVQYVERFPTAEAVIVEPDVTIFICFLAARRLGSFFRHQRLSLLVGVRPEEAASFLFSTGWSEKELFKHTVSLEIHTDWFDVFFTLLERNKMKNSINAKTLERFGKLWLKNTVKNIDALCNTAKISCFKEVFSDTVAVVLAGGPSLTAHLELIKKNEQCFLIIAVDTAMRACLHAGIVPDFILSFDPQYWNYLHTAGLDTSGSILISEAAVFPAVLRQRYRAVFLSNSSSPFARYLEQDRASCRERSDCVLAAGGSVATTSWDFARYTGAHTIIMAGLDLAYPHKQTHFTGSTFEEAVHTGSSRFASAEQANVNSLYSAFPSLHKDYAGDAVLTDRRMLLYAWWFESSLAKYPEVKTYNLMPQGIAIPGMPACSAELFVRLTGRGISRAAISERLQAIIGSAYSESFFCNRSIRERDAAASVKAMVKSAAGLAAQAEKAESLCRRLAQSRNNRQSAGERAAIIAQLNKIDKDICNGFAKDLVSILFFNSEADPIEKNNENGVEKNDMEQNNATVQSVIAAQKVYEKIRLMALQIYKIFKNH